jgi:hypothetical protein
MAHCSCSSCMFPNRFPTTFCMWGSPIIALSDIGRGIRVAKNWSHPRLLSILPNASMNYSANFADSLTHSVRRYKTSISALSQYSPSLVQMSLTPMWRGTSARRGLCNIISTGLIGIQPAYDSQLRGTCRETNHFLLSPMSPLVMFM